MALETVETGVDELMKLLERTGKLQVSEAAKQLKMPVSVVQAWADFLVEERLLGIEYKFTVPYIYLNKKVETKDQPLPDTKITLDVYKKAFIQKAREKKIPENQILQLWHNHLKKELGELLPYFNREVKKRFLSEPETLWQEFIQKNLAY